MPDHTYHAFGLNISSCLPCPVLIPAVGAGDVTIRYGDVPPELVGAVDKGVRYQAAPGLLQLRVDGIARFLVRHGQEIVIDRDPRASDDDVRPFLLGSAFGALLHQRGSLVLQASVVKVGDGCAIFLGRSGFGKSTLAAALVQRGFPCLSDDLCVVAIGDDGMPYAAPGYPEIALWPDSLRRLAIDANGLRRVRPSLHKRVWPLDGPFSPVRTSVTRSFLLWPGDTASVGLRPVEGSRKMHMLREHTYRQGFLQGLGLRVPHFRLIEHLSSRLTMTRIARPTETFVLDDLVGPVESALRT